MNGTQGQYKFLPVAHNDFIFSVLAEEKGFVGVLVALGLYLFVILRSIEAARLSKDRIGAYLVGGIIAGFCVPGDLQHYDVCRPRAGQRIDAAPHELRGLVHDCHARGVWPHPQREDEAIHQLVCFFCCVPEDDHRSRLRAHALASAWPSSRQPGPASACAAPRSSPHSGVSSMNKEMIISSGDHETRVAILEDDQVVEVFIERENQRGVVGNVYKGRVNKVLPGMQSSFVDIGLERDAFLYVSEVVNTVEDVRTARGRRGSRGRRRWRRGCRSPSPSRRVDRSRRSKPCRRASGRVSARRLSATRDVGTPDESRPDGSIDAPIAATGAPIEPDISSLAQPLGSSLAQALGPPLDQPLEQVEPRAESQERTEGPRNGRGERGRDERRGASGPRRGRDREAPARRPAGAEDRRPAQGRAGHPRPGRQGAARHQGRAPDVARDDAGPLPRVHADGRSRRRVAQDRFARGARPASRHRSRVPRAARLHRRCHHPHRRRRPLQGRHRQRPVVLPSGLDGHPPEDGIARRAPALLFQEQSLVTKLLRDC